MLRLHLSSLTANNQSIIYLQRIAGQFVGFAQTFNAGIKLPIFLQETFAISATSFGGFDCQ